MADAYGWPDANECTAKIANTAPDTMTVALLTDMLSLLKAVIAEFQSPVGALGDGGTGRNFSPTAGTRAYDGTGWPELRIDDIIPTLPYVVSLYGTPLSDVQIKQPENQAAGVGWNVLYRPQIVGGAYLTNYVSPATFPLGKQNIVVSATFGVGVTQDIWEAIRCEVAYRALVQAEVGIDGYGETIKIDGFEYDSSVGASQFALTSSLAVMHAVYTNTLCRYRDTPSGTFKRALRRMS